MKRETERERETICNLTRGIPFSLSQRQKRGDLLLFADLLLCFRRNLIWNLTQKHVMSRKKTHKHEENKNKNKLLPAGERKKKN